MILFPKRQVAAVNQIIREEMNGILKGRKQRDEHLRRTTLNEYGPGHMEDRVDTSVLEQEIESSISDMVYEAFDDDTFKLRKKAHRLFLHELFRATQRYGMGWTSLAEVGSLLDSNDNEDVIDAEMEFHSDVMAAIDEYGKKMARALIKAARPEGEDE